MLKNLLTDAWLVCDVSDRITAHDEAYAVTSTTRPIGPCARSVLQIQRVDTKDGAPDNKVHYGQQIRLVTNPYIMKKSLNLYSQPISPLAYARFSRNQEVCLNVLNNYNTVWRVLPTSGVRKERMGEPVLATDPIMLEHAATSQFLSNDNITYRNDFGNELEVSAMALATKSKGQLLAAEKQGTRVRENTHKAVPNQNFWFIELGATPEAEKPVQPEKYSSEPIVEEEVKQAAE